MVSNKIRRKRGWNIRQMRQLKLKELSNIGVLMKHVTTYFLLQICTKNLPHLFKKKINRMWSFFAYFILSRILLVAPFSVANDPPIYWRTVTPNWSQTQILSKFYLPPPQEEAISIHTVIKNNCTKLDIRTTECYVYFKGQNVTYITSLNNQRLTCFPRCFYVTDYLEIVTLS